MTGIQDIFLSHYPVEEFSHSHDKGFKPIEDDYSGNMLQLEPAVECAGFEVFIVPPAMWKVIGKEPVKDGEYQYWHFANWSGLTTWDSVRDSIVDYVEYIEQLIEEGDREDDDYESD